MYRVRVGSLLSASIFRSFSRSQMHHLLVFLFRRIFKPAEILVYLFFARSSSFKRIYRFQSFSDLDFSFMREAQASDSFCDGHGLGLLASIRSSGSSESSSFLRKHWNFGGRYQFSEKRVSFHLASALQTA